MVINLYQTVINKPDYFKQLSCKQLLFTQYDCPQSTRMASMFSEMNFVVYILSGRRTFHQPGFTLDMTAGKCAFCRKGGWLAEMKGGEGWCVLVFFIPDSYLQQFVTDYQTQLPVKKLTTGTLPQIMELDVNDTCNGFFHSMLPFFSQQPPPPESLLELKFRELLLNLLTNTGNTQLVDFIVFLSDKKTKQVLQEIMEANFTYNLSLEEYAKLTHRSLASFKRDFRAAYQTSPGKWLIERRLNHAQQLLANSAKPVQDIAFESGFENSTHFSRVFKEKFGVSPLHARKMALSLPH